MHKHRRNIAVTAALSTTLWLLLTSCSSPPKPPDVDEAAKRPVNTATAVELQVCTSALRNSSIAAAESARRAQSSAAAMQQLAARDHVVRALEARAETPQGNSIFTVHFNVGSSRVDVPTEQLNLLVEQARTAPLVVLKGRTDGIVDSLAESRVARDRAAAVRDLLVGAGVGPTVIRTTYQPIGDHVADNSADFGRAFNRRVEIEVYRAVPITTLLDPPPVRHATAQP